jgi:SAM-dependent methyltransferase
MRQVSRQRFPELTSLPISESGPLFTSERGTMKNKGFKFHSGKGIYIHCDFNGAKDSYLNDLTGKDSFNPSKMRWFNSFEMAQFLRFVIALNWTKVHFENILKRTGKKDRRVVVDMGCSWAQYYSYWRNNCNFYNWPMIDYYGIDADEYRLVAGKQMIYKKKNDRVFLCLADLTIPLGIAKADIIICLETIEHLPKKAVKNLIENFKRNLKPNGIVIVSSPNPLKDEGEQWTWKKQSRGSHAYEYSFHEATDLFHNNGFWIDDHCGILPRRNYFRECAYNEIRYDLVQVYPTPLINNILCSIDDIRQAKQWIMKLKLRRDPA